jgi:hypothetical protein
MSPASARQPENLIMKTFKCINTQVGWCCVKLSFCYLVKQLNEAGDRILDPVGAATSFAIALLGFTGLC